MGEVAQRVRLGLDASTHVTSQVSYTSLQPQFQVRWRQEDYWGVLASSLA